MPLLNDHYELTIAAHYLPALVNNDYSGLEDNEAADLDAYMRDYWKLPNATVEIPEENTHFAFDDVSGMFGDCLTIRLHFTNHALTPQQYALDLN